MSLTITFNKLGEGFGGTLNTLPLANTVEKKIKLNACWGRVN